MFFIYGVVAYYAFTHETMVVVLVPVKPGHTKQTRKLCRNGLRA